MILSVTREFSTAIVAEPRDPDSEKTKNGTGDVWALNMSVLRNFRDLANAIISENKHLLGRLIDSPVAMRNHVVKRYGLPNGLPTIDILDLFPDFKETVDPFAYMEGGSSTLDLAVLRAFARRFKDCTYLEIGTWRGESLANVASIAKRCISVDLSEQELRDFGYPDEMAKNCDFFSKDLANVERVRHSSHTYDFSRYRKSIDLAFIDGDHSYDGVRVDTQKVFDLMRDDSSVIVWHDYGDTPERVRFGVLAGILDGCPAEKRRNLYHISNTLCAVYINGDFKTSEVVYPQIPTKRFSVSISSRRT